MPLSVPQATAAIIFISAFVFILSSFGQIHTLEHSLDWNHLTQKVSDQPLQNGLVFFGTPWHTLVKFPGTMQNIVFSSADSPSDELHARTSE